MRLGEEVKPLLDGEIKLWRRTGIIIAANCFGLLIAGGALGFFSLIWDNINETKEKLTENAYNIRGLSDSSLIRHDILVNEIATLKVELQKLSKEDDYVVDKSLSLYDDDDAGGSLPPPKPKPIPEIPQEEVNQAQEMIQQKIDKAEYRRDNFNPKR